MTTLQIIIWFIGALIPVVLFFGGVGVTSFRTLSKRITEGDQRLQDQIDKVKDLYVRREDLDRDLGNINKALKEIKESINRLAGGR